MRLTILFVTALLCSGCMGCIDLWLGDRDDDQSWRWSYEVREEDPWWDDWEDEPEAREVTVLCTAAGLWLDGELLVSSDPGKEASGKCQDYVLDITGLGGSFEACCENACCTWDPPSRNLPNGKCYNSTDCGAGLGCFENPDRPYSQYGICRLAAEGEPCGAPEFVGCDAGFYCGWDDICYKTSLNEGDLCPAGDEACQWPQHCVCTKATDCHCYDGSLGDPCNSDTCEPGLYCDDYPLQSGRIAGPGSCFSGVKGDPCSASWQCDSPFSCPDGGAATKCSLILGMGEDCTEASTDPLVFCAIGSVCNDAFEPSTCTGAGHNGDPCLNDSSCASGWVCVASMKRCTDATLGSPCDESVPCVDGSTCVAGEEAGGVCLMVQQPGLQCGEAAPPFTACPVGFICNVALAIPLCLPPGMDADLCVTDEQCAPGYHCLQPNGRCYDGSELDPCGTDLDCQNGNFCALTFGLCQDGSYGDFCGQDGDCGPGNFCTPQGKCATGAPGDICAVDAECQEPAHCEELDGELQCVERVPQAMECFPEEPAILCEDGLICLESLVPPLCLLEEGGGWPCGADSDCLESHVCLIENGSGTCYALSSESEECGPAYKFAKCGPGLSCNGGYEPAICAAPGIDGDPCWEPSDCAMGYQCLLVFGGCYDGSTGDPCQSDNACQPDLQCADGFCSVPQ